MPLFPFPAPFCLLKSLLSSGSSPGGRPWPLQVSITLTLVLPMEREDFCFTRFPIKFWDWGSQAQVAFSAYPWTNLCGQREQVLWLTRSRSMLTLSTGAVIPSNSCIDRNLENVVSEGDLEFLEERGIYAGWEKTLPLYISITICPPWSHPLGFCFFRSGEGSKHLYF